MSKAIDLGICRNIDFYFNKASLSNPEVPKWIVRTKGQTHYVRHVDANVPWSTRELNEGSTQGMIRFRRAHVMIDDDIATLS